MRLELTLTPKNNKFTLPLNYQYYLYISFFIIFDNASDEFKEWVKNKSFNNRNDRFYLYNFSLLNFINGRSVDLKNISISSEGDVKIIFSTPINDEKIKKYIKDLLLNNNIYFYPAKRENQEFEITEVIEINEESIPENSYYKMISPGCYFTKNYRHFFLIGEDKLIDNIIYDLKKKYKLFYDKDYNGDISFEFDKEYIENNKVSRLITMKENTAQEYKIRAFECPFTLMASPDMQYIALTCGIGMKNKFGFGAIELSELRNEDSNNTNSINEHNNSSEVNNEGGVFNKVKKIFGFN